MLTLYIFFFAPLYTTGDVCLLLPRFHVPFWLSYILVYFCYFCPSFCPSWETEV